MDEEVDSHTHAEQLRQQLDEVRAELDEVKSVCKRLEKENQRLNESVETVKSGSTTHRTNEGAEPDAICNSMTRPMILSKASGEAADSLIAELQRQLTDVLRRNTFLEQEAQARHIALRQQYETHVERLEMELQWYRQNLSASLPRTAPSIIAGSASPSAEPTRGSAAQPA